MTSFRAASYAIVCEAFFLPAPGRAPGTSTIELPMPRPNIAFLNCAKSDGTADPLADDANAIPQPIEIPSRVKFRVCQFMRKLSNESNRERVGNPALAVESIRCTRYKEPGVVPERVKLGGCSVKTLANYRLARVSCRPIGHRDYKSLSAPRILIKLSRKSLVRLTLKMRIGNPRRVYYVDHFFLTDIY